jgi:hypothetical protein
MLAKVSTQRIFSPRAHAHIRQGQACMPNTPSTCAENRLVCMLSTGARMRFSAQGLLPHHKGACPGHALHNTHALLHNTQTRRLRSIRAPVQASEHVCLLGTGARTLDGSCITLVLVAAAACVPASTCGICACIQFVLQQQAQLATY